MYTNNRQPKSMDVLSENNVPFQRFFLLNKIFCQGTGVVYGYGKNRTCFGAMW